MPDGANTASWLQPARIFHTGRAGDLTEAVRRARAACFTHINLPPPWPHALHDPWLATSLERLDTLWTPATSLQGLAETADEGGQKLLIDVVLDRVAPEAAGADATGLFSQPPPLDRLDPRRIAPFGAAVARLQEPADAIALGAWWAQQFAAWSEAGVAGYRLLGLERVPDSLLPVLLRTLRRGAPGALLLAWTPGLGRDTLAGLQGLGLDGVFASLPWWDFRSDWLWQELEALLPIAPVFGADAVPLASLGASETAQARQVALAATLGQGWLHVAATGDAASVTASDALAARLNLARENSRALSSGFAPSLPLGDGGQVLAMLRVDAACPRSGVEAALIAINTDGERPATLAAASLLAAAGGRFGPFTAGDAPLQPGDSLTLLPGEAILFTAGAATPAAGDGKPGGITARNGASGVRLAIEAPTPSVDGGRFPVKRTAGEAVDVEADILFDGHETVAAALRWRGPSEAAWQEVAMRPLGNDRWTAQLPLAALGRHDYIVAAWRDRFGTFRDEFAKKQTAGVGITLETIEGLAIVQAAAARSTDALGQALKACLAQLQEATEKERPALLLSPALAELMSRADDRPFLVESDTIAVDAERIGARFASWYEIFPRSMSDDAARHGTFADVERHLPRIRDMGFDVLYFPPIHPIGRINRKGPNNTLTPGPDDPGSPYAVGSQDGGHDALHPQLGTFADFQSLRRAAAAHGLELAIDFAIQCSPDHPWLRDHKGWFDWRPDGTIRYAENPPKKYEDIVNVDFYAEEAVPGLWQALCDVVLFWAEQGVRLFRVDNPHTKPFPFWEWMIGEVRRQFPDTVFLAEAFTRPKIMYRLAKIGFSQSYTYFTWRNTKRELEAYLSELDEAPPRDFFRPHFFVNTPDINPVFLHSSGRPGFLIRAALAATLSGLWGVYCGFELCEASPVKPGREEYLDSEKYQIRAWDWDRPGNIVTEIRALNRVRRLNPALQTHLGVTFLLAGNDHVIYYEKATPDRSNVILVAVSLDPTYPQEADIEVPLWKFGLPDDGRISASDQLTGENEVWAGRTRRLRLTPERPYAIWRIRKEDA